MFLKDIAFHVGLFLKDLAIHVGLFLKDLAFHVGLAKLHCSATPPSVMDWLIYFYTISHGG